jgi:acyl-CoA synthetase (AMP-forming)/AMP-acid ligase II
MTNPSIFEQYTDKETFAKIVDFANITDMWEHSVKTYGDHSAVVDGEDYTYSALNAQVETFRTVLKNAGVKQGDTVGILAPNSVGFIKAYLAINTYGAAAVLLPPHLDAMTVFGCSLKFGLKAIVYDASLEASLAFAREKNPALALIDVASTADEATAAVSPDTNSLSTVIFISNEPPLVNSTVYLSPTANCSAVFASISAAKYHLESYDIFPILCFALVDSL